METLFQVIDQALFAGVLLLIALPPLLFGAVEPWGEQGVVMLALALGALWIAKRVLCPAAYEEEVLQRTHRGMHRRSLFFLAIPLGAILGWGLFTLLPLPSFLLELAHGAGARLRSAAAALSGLASAGASPLTLDVGGTVDALMLIFAALAVFVVTYDSFLDWRRTRLALEVFVGVVFCASLLAIAQAFSAGGKIFWVVPIARGTPFGSFVNRNHFAGWAGMGALAALGYLLAQRHTPPAFEHRKEPRLVVPRSDPGAVPRRILLGFMAAVIICAIFLSLSRGGMVGLMAGFMAMSFLMGLRSRLGYGWRALGILSVALGLLIWLGAEPFIERLRTFLNFGRESFEAHRKAISMDTLRMAWEHRWTGSGPGTYAGTYPLHQTVFPENRVSFAHNDYAQMLAEWGLAGVVIFGGLIGVYCWRFVKYWNHRNNRELILVAAGCAGAVASILFHSFVDFNLHIPSNAMAAAFLAASGLKVLTLRTAPRGEASMRARRHYAEQFPDDLGEDDSLAESEPGVVQSPTE